MGLFSPSLANVAIAAGLFFLYVLGLYIYRAFFDSLSHIPGPKLAAATLWYEFYYDVVKAGRYTWEIGKMHEKYGKPEDTWLTPSTCYTVALAKRMADPSHNGIFAQWSLG